MSHGEENNSKKRDNLVEARYIMKEKVNSGGEDSSWRKGEPMEEKIYHGAEDMS